MAIQQINNETKEKIKRKTAYGFPNKPSASGIPPEIIKRTSYAPLVDDENSIVAEINRLVDEANAEISDVGVSLTTLDEKFSEHTTGENSHTKSQVGLGNVDNEKQIPMSYLDDDEYLGGENASDKKVPTQKAVKEFVGDITKDAQSDWTEENVLKTSYIKNKPTAVSDFTNDLDYQTNTEVDTTVETHNTDASAHSAIQTKIGTDIATHNESGTAHNDIRIILDGTFKNAVYSAGDGKITFTKNDNSTIVIDLPLELIVESGSYDSIAEELVLTLANGDTINIPVSALMNEYFADDTTLTLYTDSADGNKLKFKLKDSVKDNYDTAYTHSQETGNPHGADADDISDTETTNKFVTAEEKTAIANAVPNIRKVNNKALDADITLNTADIPYDETKNTKEVLDDKVAKTSNILIGDGAGNAVDSGISASTILNTLTAVTTTGNPVNIQNTNDGFVDKVKITNDTASAISSPLTGKSVNKNLFDISQDYEGGIFDANGLLDRQQWFGSFNKINQTLQITTTGTSCGVVGTKFYPCIGGGTISVSTLETFLSTTFVVLVFYDENKTFISRIMKSITTGKSENISIPATAKFFREGWRFEDAVTGVEITPQIEFGTTATDYVEHSETAFSIPLKDTSGTVLDLNPADEIKLIDGKYHLNDTELHDDSQDALRAIPTKAGQTNLIGDQPFTFDVTEFQLGLESIDAMLTLPNGKRVNVITKDRLIYITSGEYKGKTLDYALQELKNEIDGKQDALTFDDTPTSGSNNPVKSGGIKTAIDNMTLGDVADNSIPLSKLKSVSVDVSLSPQFFDFVDKDWSGLTDFLGDRIWTDGKNIYYSYSSTQKVLNIATSTWNDKVWSGLTDFRGFHIWTDGNNIYYSRDTTQKVLNIATSTWSDKTWSGLTDFYGSNIWTDGTNIYYSRSTTQKVLNIATGEWSDKTWSGMTDFYGRADFFGQYIWTDGANIYYSYLSTQKVLDVATSAWNDKTWSGMTDFYGEDIWTDGKNIYYSYSSTQKVLDVATSTWSDKTWNGLTNFRGSYIWTDGTNMYYSNGSTQKVLITNKKIRR